MHRGPFLNVSPNLKVITSSMVFEGHRLKNYRRPMRTCILYCKVQKIFNFNCKRFTCQLKKVPSIDENIFHVGRCFQIQGNKKPWSG
jgi:hypothetical protein